MNAVRLEHAGAVARLTLDRPPLNVLDIATLREMTAALAEARALPGLRVLTIAGAGKAFCAGVDVADHTADRVEGMLDAFHEVIRQVLNFEAPVVALVHGAALGGGCELALACDMVLARDDLRLGLPEIRLGVFPPVAAALLPRLVGRLVAMELVLTGRSLTAIEAQRLGLVTAIYETDFFPAHAERFIAGLAAQSGTAMRMAKLAVAGSGALPFGSAIERIEELYLRDLMPTPDAREGLAAFLEKRAPVWQEA